MDSIFVQAPLSEVRIPLLRASPRSVDCMFASEPSVEQIHRTVSARKRVMLLVSCYCRAVAMNDIAMLSYYRASVVLLPFCGVAMILTCCRQASSTVTHTHTHAHTHTHIYIYIYTYICLLNKNKMNRYVCNYVNKRRCMHAYISF